MGALLSQGELTQIARRSPTTRRVLTLLLLVVCVLMVSGDAEQLEFARA